MTSSLEKHLASYADPPPVPCPVTAIGWAEDTDVPPEAMSGWAACGDTEFVTFPGVHHEFIAAPPCLLAALRAGVTGG